MAKDLLSSKCRRPFDCSIWGLSSARKGVANDGYQKRLDELGLLPPSNKEMTPEYVRRFIPTEIEKFRKLLTETK